MDTMTKPILCLSKKYNKNLTEGMKVPKTNLSFEKRRVSAESSGQYVIVDLVAQITTKYAKVICTVTSKDGI